MKNQLQWIKYSFFIMSILIVLIILYPFIVDLFRFGKLSMRDSVFVSYTLIVLLGLTISIPYLGINVWGFIVNKQYKWVHGIMAVLSIFWIIWGIIRSKNMVWP